MVPQINQATDLIVGSVKDDGTELQGKFDFTSVKDASGVYTVTLKRRSSRDITVFGIVPKVVDLTYAVTAKDEDSFTVAFLTTADTPVATDTDFDFALATYRTKSESK